MAILLNLTGALPTPPVTPPTPVTATPTPTVEQLNYAIRHGLKPMPLSAPDQEASAEYQNTVRTRGAY